MATNIENTRVLTIDGEDVEIRPLKIKYLKKFMKAFEELQDEEVALDNIKSADVLMKCMTVAFKQYKPEWASVEVLEEKLDLGQVYEVVEIAAGIKFGGDGNPNQTGLPGTT